MDQISRGVEHGQNGPVAFPVCSGQVAAIRGPGDRFIPVIAAKA